MKNTRILIFFVFLVLSANVRATNPSPIRIEANKLLPGVLVKMQIDNIPVFVLARRSDEIAALRKSHAGNKEQVADCSACEPVLRSISPSYFVIWGRNTSSECELVYVSSTATDWVGYAVHGRGGFIDKCSASEYDLSGRKLAGPKTSPNRLGVPAHAFRNGLIEIKTKPSLKGNAPTENIIGLAEGVSEEPWNCDADRSSVSRATTRLKPREVIRLASVATKKRGVDLGKFKQSTICFSEMRATWTVFFEGLVPGPGIHFLLWVNDKNGEAEYMPGE